MEKQLSPTTKEFIYFKIKECEQEIRMIYQGIEKAEASEIQKTKEFIEFWYIEIEMFRKQIEELKQMLFTR
jgi:hypothetical protein